jgi:putative ABC transport system permease protein
VLPNVVKVALRNIRRHKGYAFINITGLAIGMACTLMILVYVANELSFENFHALRKRIYRVETDFGTGTGQIRFAGAMEAIGPAMKVQVPEVEDAVRLQWDSEARIRIGDQTFQEKNFFFADPSLFHIFSFSLTKGDLSSVLREPFSAVISETVAEKYFGHENPIGKVFDYHDNQTIQVQGVMQDVPMNTHLRCDILVSYTSLESMGRASANPWMRVGQVFTYLLLKEQTPPAGLINKMNELLAENSNPFFAKLITFHLRPIRDIYMNSDAIVDLGPKGNRNYVVIFSIVACFVLIIACFNFMNLATAHSMRRIKEVGMRKALGAKRFQLIRQFLGESLIIAFIAVVFGLLLFELGYPVLNTFLQNHLSIGQQHYWYLFILIPGMTLIVGFLAGIYPAFFLSRFTPIEGLDTRGSSPSKPSTLRKVLVIAQFTLSIGLVAGTTVIFKQLHFMQTTDLGFSERNVLVVPFKMEHAEDREKYNLLRDRLLQDADVMAVSGAYAFPGILSKETKTVQRPGVGDQEPFTIQSVSVDYDFASVMGLDILQGRNFSRTISTDETRGVLINQEAARRLQLSEPVGATLTIPMAGEAVEVTVLGVVRDFHIRSLREKIGPLLLYIDPSKFYYVAVRFRPDKRGSMLAAVENVWNTVLTDVPYSSFYLEDQYRSLYRSEEKIGQLLTVFSFLAIFVSCLGLYGLVSFMTTRRTKEIGIRKVLGASVPKVVLLFTGNFIQWILVSNVTAWIGSYFFMSRWLQNYAYRIPIRVWIFIPAGVLTLVVALLTISYQAVRAALMNPVETLKYE